MKPEKMLYLPLWYVKNVILGGHGPLQTVIAITDCCNLACRHCASSVHACTAMKSFGQIKEELAAAYKAGSRFVDFEGGEPVLWRDETYTLNDLYDLAHEIGFFHCTLTTNGQQPFGDTRADFVWVSVDGNQACHDLVRGKGTFQVLDRNIRKSGLKNVAINMVIHKNNVSSVTETIRYARENPAVCAISLNFLTPYPGTEELLLPWETRKKVIDHIIKMKKAGYPIINSCSGLKRMKERKTHHNCWISHFILLDGTWKECPGKELGICMDCGFSMAGEMDGVAGLRPDTILAGLKLRNSWWKNRKKKKNTGRKIAMKEMGQTGQIMERALAQTEKKMKQIAQGVLKDKLSGTMVREALAAPGKMLRPQMLILSACLIDETAAAAHMEHLVRWGAILELCHTASLLHDDVIDQSPIRRGRPTLMKRYGNSSAIYAGDYVLACVLREVLKSHGEDRALLLTDGIEEMCVGEMNQTRCRYRQNVTIEQYNKNIAGKTGVLFAAACRLGAMEVTEDPKIAEEYEQLGRKLGRAFQLRDDLLDITSDAKAAGKLVMQDFREGIYTLPVLLARDHTTFGPVVRTLMKKSRKGILREEDLEALKEALLKSRAIDRVSQEIRGLLEECRHAAGHSSCLWAKKRTEAILDRLKTMEGCRASDIQGAVVKK